MPATYVYLDHNASSPLRPAAFDAMVEKQLDYVREWGGKLVVAIPRLEVLE